MDPISIKSISNGIKDIIKCNGFFRSHIYTLELNGVFNIFTEKHIIDTYSNAVESIECH